MRFIITRTLLKSSLILFSIIEIQAQDKVEITRLQDLATRMNEPGYRFSQTNLILEQTLWVKANDGAGCFPEPCYRITFEKDGKQGITHIIPSIHFFPFTWLPLGYRYAIYNSDFLVSEDGPEEDDKPTDLEKMKWPKPLSLSWFNSLSIDAQKILREEISILLKEEPDISAEAKDFNQFHPITFFFFCLGRIARKVQGMDIFLDKLFKTHLALEPEQVSELTERFYMTGSGISQEDWVKEIEHCTKRLRSNFEYKDFIEDEEDYKREDLITRNIYWIENTLSQAFQPEKTGLLTFGGTHAKGPHGIITFLKSVLADTDWAKNKRSPAEIRLWKGIHFLRMEQLKKRHWVEVPPKFTE